MPLKTFNSESAFIEASVKFLEDVCFDPQNHNNIRIALSGGSTPAPIYRAFAERAKFTPKTRIAFYEVDERHVPRDHRDSNQKLIRENLKKNLSPDRGELESGYAFHFFNTSLPIPECLTDYEYHLKKTTFDLAILGLGPDGHTASLFPNSPALHEIKRLVAHTTTDQFPVRDRLTLTFPAIMASKKLLLLLKGKEKESILHELLHSKKSTDELPAKKLLEHPHLTIHYSFI